VLSRLLENKLFVKAEKCEFHASEFLPLIPGLCRVPEPHQDGPREAERNYGVGNWELLAIKVALEKWRHWLEGAEQPFLVWTDHKNLEYLKSAKRLNSRQARGPQFTSGFWSLEFCQLLGATVSLSSGYHPESNGQTERLNQELETCLRCLVAQNQTTWSDHLTWMEYAHNSLPTAATGLSPFQVIHGYQLPLFPANEEEVTVPSAHALARRSLRVHPTFHVSKIKPVRENYLVPPTKPPPLPKMVEGGPVYAVKKLL
ncbi:hypothetical protein L3Q82_021575, partial [Scortum barcoo]